jgi:hypothetical protein
MLNDEEMAALVERCRTVPPAANVSVATDMVTALLETVVDYQMRTTTVGRAMQHFATERADEVRTFDDLEAWLARFPDTEDGNVDLAISLWGYRLWTRAQQLRGLVAYFDARRVRTLEALRSWARTSTYQDFQGHVKGLGPTVYQALVMRLGRETVKPDVHVLRFVAAAIGRTVKAGEAVEALEAVAHALGVTATRLDLSIWEYQRRSV